MKTYYFFQLKKYKWFHVEENLKKKMHQTQTERFQVTEAKCSLKVKLYQLQLLSSECLELSNFNVLKISNIYARAEVLRFSLNWFVHYKSMVNHE